MKSGKLFSFRSISLMTLACVLILSLSLPQKQAAAAGTSVKGFYVSDSKLYNATNSRYPAQERHPHIRHSALKCDFLSPLLK